MTVEDIIKTPNVILIDVREAIELEEEGSVPGALLIPLADIPDKIEQIEAMPKPLIIFCRSGNRSGRAIEWLNNQGVEGLYNGGGFRDVLTALEN